MPDDSTRISAKHFEIIKESGILNTDVTLQTLMDVGSGLSALKGGDAVTVPTLVGDWYVYHQIVRTPEIVTNPAKRGGGVQGTAVP